LLDLRSRTEETRGQREGGEWPSER
jgi:hypothetical protein